MTAHLWFTLLALAQLGAASSSIRTSTNQLAKMLNVSQQTASRRLQLLEKKELIRRTLTTRGQSIRIEPKGLAQLKRVYSILTMIVAKKRTVTIRGRVFTGLGEGAYYVSLDGYRQQFRNKLGFDPFPGTLNLQLVNDSDVFEFELLKAMEAIEIYGFEDGDRSFGPVYCFKVRVNEKIDAVVLVIERTHHRLEVIEIIAPINLREHLGLEDGDLVTVSASLI
jgi:riboflavin kinase